MEIRRSSSFMHGCLKGFFINKLFLSVVVVSLQRFEVVQLLAGKTVITQDPE